MYTMDSTQKKRILSNFKDCATKIRAVNELIDKLVSKGLSERKLRENFTNEDRHNRICLFFNLMEIPDAYPKLLEALKETNCIELENNLRERNSNGNKVFRTIQPLYNPPVEENANLNSLKLLDIKVTRSMEFKDTTYCTRSENRGIVLIINNSTFADPVGENIEKIDKKYEDRYGSEADVINLKNLFEKMGGYKVIIKKNLTAQQMQTEIKDFAKFDYQKIADICFVIVMTHGILYEGQCVVAGIDNFHIETNWIIEQFNSKSCEFLIGKPKIFLFQCCRGSFKDMARTQMDGDFILKYNRSISDVLVAYPSVFGYKSHRDINEGAWFIRNLCEIFMEHAHNLHIEEMLKKVDEKLRNSVSEFNTMQTLDFQNMGFRNCYLNPGIYEKNGQLCRF